MFLKSVTAFGFKSFAERTALEFGAGITAVVGPNGSGKSNISDAVRWVLGEQSAKYLRGSKMEDIIFSGTSRRRPLGVAEVTLVFDNRDHMLPLDFDEVSITRRLYRSGDSDYAINKKNCRLKDILDLLADTGMGKGAMFLIGQNKIDEILNSRPEDRRSIFEEAAGIARFRMRKKEATRRLDDTANNLTRINDIKSEVESRVEPLRIESERTTRFNELNGKLRICKLTQFVQRVETIEQARSKLQQEQEDCNRVFLEKSTEVSGQDVLDERIEQSIRQQGNIAKRNEKLQEQIDQWTAQMETLAKEFDVLEAKRDEAAALVTNLEQQQQERLQAQKDNEAKIQELTDSNFEDMRKMVELRNEIRQLETEQEQRMNRRNRLKDDVDAAEQRVAELTEEQRSLISRKGELEQDVARYIKEGNELAGTAAERRTLFQTIERKYNECQTQIAAVESRLHLLRDMQQSLEGFGFGVKAVVQSREDWHEDVIGPAAALISVEPEYVTAVETALGAGAQNIVIRSAEAAKRAIRYLKEHKEGRATFLPLDTLKEPVLKADEKALVKLPGIRGFAADLLQCEEEVKPAVRFLVSRVLVAETMDHALAAAKKSNFRLRVVTLDGDVRGSAESADGTGRTGRAGKTALRIAGHGTAEKYPPDGNEGGRAASVR